MTVLSNFGQFVSLVQFPDGSVGPILGHSALREHASKTSGLSIISLELAAVLSHKPLGICYHVADGFNRTQVLPPIAFEVTEGPHDHLKQIILETAKPWFSDVDSITVDDFTLKPKTVKLGIRTYQAVWTCSTTLFPPLLKHPDPILSVKDCLTFTFTPHDTDPLDAEWCDHHAGRIVTTETTYLDNLNDSLFLVLNRVSSSPIDHTFTCCSNTTTQIVSILGRRM